MTTASQLVKGGQSLITKQHTIKPKKKTWQMGSKQWQWRPLQYTKVVAIQSNISSVAWLEMGTVNSLSCLCSQDLRIGVVQGSHLKAWAVLFYTLLSICAKQKV